MSAPIRLGIFGRGRLGSAIARAAEADDRFTLAWCVGRDPEPESAVDVAIDASSGEAVALHLEWAVAEATPLVIGATGWDPEILEAGAGSLPGVVIAPNFSLGAALLRRLATVLAGVADRDPDADPYVVERHHRHKVDAPSGTARLLADAVVETCGRKTEWVLVSGAVEPHQLAVSSVRAGAELGSHTVGLDSPAEVLEVTHRARSRDVYASGALTAAAWIRTRRGVHGFDAVVAEILDPLLAPGAKGGT